MKNQTPTPEPHNQPSKKRPYNNAEWLKYSSIAFQILATMLVGIGVGYVLDKYIPLGFPVFKLVCFFGAVLVALYVFIKEVSKKE